MRQAGGRADGGKLVSRPSAKPVAVAAASRRILGEAVAASESEGYFSCHFACFAGKAIVQVASFHFSLFAHYEMVVNPAAKSEIVPHINR